MKKFAKRSGFALLLFIALFSIASLLLTGIFEKQVGNKLVAEINQQLSSKLVVDNFKLSFMATFPNVAANLKGVVLEDSQDGVLLEAENLSFRFGFLSLFAKKLNVKTIVLSNGSINVAYDQQGNGNFNIFKSGGENEDEKSTSGPSIKLKKARIQNMEVIYSHEADQQDIFSKIKDATFSGEFSSKQFSLKSTANILCRFVEMDQVRYLPGEDISYDADINIDLENGLYDFKKVVLKIGPNEFDVDGKVEQKDNKTQFDLLLVNEKGNLSAVTKLLPEKYKQQLGDFKSSGDFDFNVSIQGESSKYSTPEIFAEFSLDNGKITSPRLSNDFKDVAFNATFNRGNTLSGKNSYFKIENLKGYFNRELIELRLRVEDFSDPEVDFQLDGVLPIGAIYNLTNNPKITTGSGEIEIKNLSLNGKYADMINTSRISRVKAGGELEFDDASLTVNDEKMILDQGNLKLENNLLTIENLKLEGAGSEIAFNGNAFNIIPVLFADSMNTKRAELEFNATLTSPELDIDRLMKLSVVAVNKTRVSEEVLDSLKVEEIQKRERITNFLRGTFDANIESFNFNKIKGNNFNGQLKFENNQLTIKGDAKGMEGSFDLEGEVFFKEEPRLHAKIDCKDINVNEFFKQTENFGQEVLTEKNLKGTLNSKISINAFWDNEGNYVPGKLTVLAGIGILDGELIKLDMLERFSTFVNIKDLRNIKFVNIQNFLEYRNNKLYIPEMFIQSNAMNLSISGEHSFDNDIRYNLKVNAGQVLANKFKSHDKTLKPLKARKKGFFNLYYTIFGNVTDYQFKSAKRQVKSDFELSQLRKREIQLALEREFGFVQLIQEPIEWSDIPESDNFDPDDPEFLEEIRTDTTSTNR